MNFLDSYVVAYMIGALTVVVCSGFVMNVITESIQNVYRQNEEKIKREKKARKEKESQVVIVETKE